MKETQRVPFRLIQCPHCGILLCWVNPRLPNYCPECSKYIFDTVKSNIIQNYDAWLSYDR
jgi:DNA-directed RNA polymerase subunit RPC12/RpoP